MPAGVRNAVLERGYTDDDQMTPMRAMQEWSGWNLGSEDWATEIINHFEELKSITLKEPKP